AVALVHGVGRVRRGDVPRQGVHGGGGAVLPRQIGGGRRPTAGRGGDHGVPRVPREGNGDPATWAGAGGGDAGDRAGVADEREAERADRDGAQGRVPRGDDGRDRAAAPERGVAVAQDGAGEDAAGEGAEAGGESPGSETGVQKLIAAATRTNGPRNTTLPRSTASFRAASVLGASSKRRRVAAGLRLRGAALEREPGGEREAPARGDGARRDQRDGGEAIVGGERIEPRVGDEGAAVAELETPHRLPVIDRRRRGLRRRD